MKILAIEHERPGVTPEQFAPLLKAEAQRVWELYQAGSVRESYFRQDQSSAVLILECDDRQQAETLLQSLPLVQAGLITFEVVALVPYPGFGRLFT
jgi:hypothetical protein